MSRYIKQTLNKRWKIGIESTYYFIVLLLILSEDFKGNNFKLSTFVGQVNSFQTVRLGGPQGSVLGPFLLPPFLSLSFPLVLYASDTFFMSSNNDITILEANQNKAMDKALQWLKANSV